MIKLIPNWIETNDEFWSSLKRRNLFLIKLRFIAVLMLIVFDYLYETLVDIGLTDFQHWVIGLITLFLFLYNLVLVVVRAKIKNQKNSFNPLHLSLVQILTDLIVLTLLIIFTGGIESPLYLFYIFHLIIGSLILPGFVIYSIAGWIIISMILIATFQYFSIIPHYCVAGIYKVELYNNSEYVFTTLLFFSLMTIISVFLTNRIANQLYSQEKKLYEALKEINNSELKKQKYIMGVVHEIKSPIAATKSIVSLILDGFVGEVSPKVNVKLNRAIIRLNESLEMINNVLRISRLRLLNEKTSENINVVELINEILEKNRERFIEKQIQLKTSISGTSRIIKGDRELLKLAFSNLISNAIKYTKKNGSVKLTSNFENEFVQISICDSGIGIPKGELEKIFENYYRANTPEHKTKEGVGVGLSIVKEIINQHRGSITAFSPSSIGSRENPGACFEIIIPYELKELTNKNNNFLSVKNGV